MRRWWFPRGTDRKTPKRRGVTRSPGHELPLADAEAAEPDIRFRRDRFQLKNSALRASCSLAQKWFDQPIRAGAMIDGLSLIGAGRVREPPSGGFGLDQAGRFTAGAPSGKIPEARFQRASQNSALAIPRRVLRFVTDPHCPGPSGLPHHHQARPKSSGADFRRSNRLFEQQGD